MSFALAQPGSFGRLLFVVLVGTALLGSAAVAGAVAGPVGEEFAISDRTLPPAEWWKSCTDGDGRRVTLIGDCEGDECEEHGDLFLQRYGLDGNKLGSPVRVNDEPAWRVGFRVTCSDDGWVAAQWLEAGCYRQRTVDPQNSLVGSAVVASPTDCRTRASLAVHDDGSMLAVWPGALPSQGTQIFARRFVAGEANGDGVQISEGPAGWRLQPKVALDAGGLALVAWLGQETLDSGHGPVMGRFVDEDGQPVEAPFQINTFAYGTNLDPSIRRLSAGQFEVNWTNVLEGGRIAREVHATGGLSPAAAAFEDEESPRFGAVRVVDSFLGDGSRLPELDAGSGATWMISDAYADHWLSDDDSAAWTPPFPAAGQVHSREVAGSNGAGVWVSLNVDDGSGDLHFSRSTDNGVTWTDLAATVHSPGAWIRNPSIEGSGSTWVAAWSLNDAQSSVVFTRSQDGGLTWSQPKSVATGTDWGRNGFDLATDAGGTWIVMLADLGIRFLRSSDDGKSWSAPPATVTSAYCESCAGLWRNTRVDLAHGGDGEWLAVFGALRFQNEVYGRDGDVFVLRSTSGGASWSPPIPIAAHQSGDGSPDFGPAIATDGDRWVATWVSHHPIGEGDNLDSDVVVSVSTDGGQTWAAPRLLAAAMDSDEASDDHVSLAARSGGRWVAGWERRGFAPVDGYVTTAIVVAAADATCGNGEVEIGEACDDANLVDGDGCDSNCTVSGCGNGIVASGEQCDDGNHEEGDSCSSDCAQPFCGDGVVSPWEGCDDGNAVDTDECPNHCGGPRCGDGIVQTGIEDCDSGGAITPACTPDCRFTRCGDGYLIPRVEACDDGNDVDDDACPNDCSRAVCGDGTTSLGWEECDPNDPLYASACTADCVLIGICGDANADQQVTTADARRVLESAVDLPVDCPRAACDMDANKRVNVTDAQMDLRKAVGLAVGDKCSIGTGTIVFWIDETRAIGSFQFDIDYSSTGGEFPGSGGDVECAAFAENGDQFAAAFNDVDAYDLLTAGFISTVTFSGKLDLFHCEFEMPEERVGTHFAIRVVDVTDVDGNPMSPPPLVGYRVE